MTAFQWYLPDIERTTLLGEVIDCVFIRRPDWIPIFPLETGKLFMFIVLYIVDPDITSYRKGFMFVPEVFVPFQILVEDLISGFIVMRVQGQGCENHFLGCVPLRSELCRAVGRSAAEIERSKPYALKSILWLSIVNPVGITSVE